MKNKKILIIDTSVVLSGKPIHFEGYAMITTTGVNNELKPGGRDYHLFQLLKEKGLKIIEPAKKSIEQIEKTATSTGDIERLSKTDIELIALAYELKKRGDKPVILTDDYSIQNVADTLNIEYENFNQLKITKRFKWSYRCRGCGRVFRETIKICPICGSDTKKIVSSEKNIKQKCDTK